MLHRISITGKWFPVQGLPGHFYWNNKNDRSWILFSCALLWALRNLLYLFVCSSTCKIFIYVLFVIRGKISQFPEKRNKKSSHYRVWCRFTLRNGLGNPMETCCSGRLGHWTFNPVPVEPRFSGSGGRWSSSLRPSSFFFLTTPGNGPLDLAHF